MQITHFPNQVCGYSFSEVYSPENDFELPTYHILIGMCVYYPRTKNVLPWPRRGPVWHSVMAVANQHSVEHFNHHFCCPSTSRLSFALKLHLSSRIIKGENLKYLLFISHCNFPSACRLVVRITFDANNLKQLKYKIEAQ